LTGGYNVQKVFTDVAPVGDCGHFESVEWNFEQVCLILKIEQLVKNT